MAAPNPLRISTSLTDTTSHLRFAVNKREKIGIETLFVRASSEGGVQTLRTT